MNPKFTVFTATYNRAYIINNLYESLCNQTFSNFEWLIVDDGSEDDTEQIVHEWEKICKKFKIVYKKVTNGGKPRAINIGVKMAQGEYFIIVDSDDCLTCDALEKMDAWCKEIEQQDNFIGVGGARGHFDGTYIKGIAPKVNEHGYIDATNLERRKYELDADMCEAYKTKLFRRFPMAEWPGENFAPEQIALNNIALAGYKIRWHKDIICLCEYLEDGLTKGSSRLEKQNPMGYAMMYNHQLLYEISRREKLYAACQHIALSLYGKHPEYILKSNNLMYTILTLPVGMILSVRRWIQYRKV